jgi:undecaprenyl-diphosphatase
VTVLQSLTLGLVQGLTEFLPISSSGHLILASRVFGWPDQGLAFDATIHLGTALALLIYFWNDLILIFRDEWRLGAIVLIATIPGGVAGLVLERAAEEHFRSVNLVGAAMIIGGVVMFLADRFVYRSRTRHVRDVSWGQGLFVGCAQVLALIPGISRSGVSIVGGLVARMNRPTAARFAFLLGLPITAAAGVLKGLKTLSHGLPADQGGVLAVGLLAALASGLVAIAFLIRYLQRHDLTPFVLYRLALGLAILWLAR